jgi:hypothetical protein
MADKPKPKPKSVPKVEQPDFTDEDIRAAEAALDKSQKDKGKSK